MLLFQAELQGPKLQLDYLYIRPLTKPSPKIAKRLADEFTKNRRCVDNAVVLYLNKTGED